jgi:hypothetical protein
MSIFKRIFGPSQEEIWQQLCDEIPNAEFIKGGFWQGSNKVVVTFKRWKIILDTYTTSHTTSGGYGSTYSTSTTYTRMRAAYVSNDGLWFKINRRGWFSELGKLFGGQDIQVGDPEFESNFIIQGNDETKVRQLFTNARIRDLILQQQSIVFEIKDNESFFGQRFPSDVDELYFEVTGTIEDVERLKSLFDLFAQTLKQLCRIGSAYEIDPNVEL